MNEHTEQIDCFNNPNWNDEALKRCKYMRQWLTCILCCNEEMCGKLSCITLEDEIIDDDYDWLY